MKLLARFDEAHSKKSILEEVLHVPVHDQRPFSMPPPFGNVRLWLSFNVERLSPIVPERLRQPFYNRRSLPSHSRTFPNGGGIVAANGRANFCSRTVAPVIMPGQTKEQLAE